MPKKRVFISYDFDNDKALKEFIIGQSRHSDSPFECLDFSLREAAPEHNWHVEAERKINMSDMVIVMVGQTTYRAPGVLKEVAIARRLRKPIIQIKGYREPTKCPPVADAGTYYTWSWDNLKRVLGA